MSESLNSFSIYKRIIHPTENNFSVQIILLKVESRLDFFYLNLTIIKKMKCNYNLKFTQGEWKSHIFLTQTGGSSYQNIQKYWKATLLNIN